jgi:quercetin 2,3-dioxygenase
MSAWDRRQFLAYSAGVIAAAGALDTIGSRWTGARAANVPPDMPNSSLAPEWLADNVLHPVEVSGPDAEAIVGRLPGSRHLYLLPEGKGEYHRVGGFTVTRMARPIETGGVYEFMSFAGRAGAVMPAHLHRGSHAFIYVTGGEIELDLDGRLWRMKRSDFANIPPGVAHGWTMRSDDASLVLWSMNDRVGAAFTAMGLPAEGPEPPSNEPIAPEKLADAAFVGDFMLMPASAARGEATRVSNLLLPFTPGPYVLADGGGERFGYNTFLAKNVNSNGQFLVITSEGSGVARPNDPFGMGVSRGVGPHFHARHTENFFGVDGETLAWAYGKALPLRRGDFLQAPPRNMHGFHWVGSYNRFLGLLTPGIFEPFFTGGKAGQNGVGGRSPGGEIPTVTSMINHQHAGAPGPPGGDFYMAMMMSVRGADGYPLDVHNHTLPLPPQDPLWIQSERG